MGFNKVFDLFKTDFQPHEKSHHQFTITNIQRHANRQWRILRRGGRRRSIEISCASGHRTSRMV